MDIGLCLPYMKKDYDRATILEWCRRIDQGPFSSLSCGERITGYTYEMRTLLSAAAAVTERVRICPSLYVLPMHSAVWAAKEIATLDILSAGRVMLTVGVGGREQDYAAVGASFKNRHQRMDEQIAQMRSVWAGVAPLEGVDPVGPLPYQAGGPQILAGAMGPKAMARAARWADGLFSFAMGGEKDLTAHFMHAGQEAWQQAGRESRPYFVGGFWYSLAPGARENLQEYVYNYLKIFGEDQARQVASTMTLHNADAVKAAIDDMQEIGVDELYLSPVTTSYQEIEALEDIIASR